MRAKERERLRRAIKLPTYTVTGRHVVSALLLLLLLQATLKQQLLLLLLLFCRVVHVYWSDWYVVFAGASRFSEPIKGQPLFVRPFGLFLAAAP